MKTVGVAALKSNLSRYLAAVRKGDEIVVTSHRHAIARIVPAEKAVDDLKIISGKETGVFAQENRSPYSASRSGG